MPSRSRLASPIGTARGVRVRTAGLLAVATAALSAPATLAGIPVGPQVSIRGSARVQGLPAGWRLSLSAFRHGSLSTIRPDLQMRNQARTAKAEESWAVATAKVSWSSGSASSPAPCDWTQGRSWPEVIRNGTAAQRVPLKLPVTVRRETFDGTRARPTHLPAAESPSDQR